MSTAELTLTEGAASAFDALVGVFRVVTSPELAGDAPSYSLTLGDGGFSFGFGGGDGGGAAAPAVDGGGAADGGGAPAPAPE